MKITEKPVMDGKISIAKKEFIRGGIRIKHPSGVEAVTQLTDMKRARETLKGFLDFHTQQLRDLDADIARVEAASKT